MRFKERESMKMPTISKYFKNLETPKGEHEKLKEVIATTKEAIEVSLEVIKAINASIS